MMGVVWGNHCREQNQCLGQVIVGRRVPQTSTHFASSSGNWMQTTGQGVTGIATTNYRGSPHPLLLYFPSFGQTTRTHMTQRQGMGHTSIQKSLDKSSGRNGLRRKGPRTRAVSWRAPTRPGINSLVARLESSGDSWRARRGSRGSSCLLIMKSGMSDLNKCDDGTGVHWWSVSPDPGALGINLGRHRGFTGRELLLETRRVLSARWGGG